MSKHRDTVQSSSSASSDVASRAELDASCSNTVLLFYGSAVCWLLIGTLLAIVASIKMHTPSFLSQWEFLSFGRVRPAHLNTVVYGWASMAGVGTMLWLESRLCKVRLPLEPLLFAMGILWNLAVIAGTVAILNGYSTGVEWLEFPGEISVGFAVVFVVVIAASMKMFAGRRVSHIYVSQWYLFGAVLWFPFLYMVANLLIHGNLTKGVAQATTNWWFAHNVLGLWLTPIGLASAYYLIPKVLGRPIHSYYLSVMGFWTLALFYNWAGTHHLIGGPVPAWVITVGIAGSLMMFIPVITVGINHHMTMVGNFGALRFSPTLRFIVFGAMSYTAVSVQGSLQAIRSINEVTHFTHYTIAHAHLGVYSFFTMTMFGAMYYIMPRLTQREWSSVRLIKVHFWCVALGMIMYWIDLTWGGILQGLKMNDPDVPFLDIVNFMLPFLWSRSVAGMLMAIGHVAFAVLVYRMFQRRASVQTGPTLFQPRPEVVGDAPTP